MKSTTLVFLGTGAAGGTPGKGKSNRLESSLLVKSDVNILIDLTRDFNKQAHRIDKINAILITHGHADASGGIASLREFTQRLTPILAHEKTITVIKRRFKITDHCLFTPVNEKSKVKIGLWTVNAIEVPHTRRSEFPTFAWKLSSPPQTIVYVSDISEITTQLKNFSTGIDTLIIDGAMWKKQIYTHLTIDKVLPKICKWQVKKIILTQIGKTAPPHEALEKEVKKICPKATPAFDGYIMKL